MSTVDLLLTSPINCKGNCSHSSEKVSVSQLHRTGTDSGPKHRCQAPFLTSQSIQDTCSRAGRYSTGCLRDCALLQRQLEVGRILQIMLNITRQQRPGACVAFLTSGRPVKNSSWPAAPLQEGLQLNGTSPKRLDATLPSPRKRASYTSASVSIYNLTFMSSTREALRIG